MYENQICLRTLYSKVKTNSSKKHVIKKFQEAAKLTVNMFLASKKEEVEVADVWEEEEQERHWQRYH